VKELRAATKRRAIAVLHSESEVGDGATSLDS
jgi:hypothetical protein